MALNYGFKLEIIQDSMLIIIIVSSFFFLFCFVFLKLEA